jgi:integrase
MQAYRAALEGSVPQCKPNPRKSASAGSLKWLCEAYYGSAEFKLLDPSTSRVRRNLLDELCRIHGEKPANLMEVRHVRNIRDARANHPEAANAILKALRQVFSYGVDAELVDQNPAKDVPYLKSGSQGFHSWTPEDLRQFEDRHPVGTKARLAFAFLFETGQRRSDVIKFGRQHIRDGCISFTQHKNRNRKPVSLSIPLFLNYRKLSRLRHAAISRFWSQNLDGPSRPPVLATNFDTGAIKRASRIALRTGFGKRLRRAWRSWARASTKSWP